jgi:hypothetical protein
VVADAAGLAETVVGEVFDVKGRSPDVAADVEFRARWPRGEELVLKEGRWRWVGVEGVEGFAVCGLVGLLRILGRDCRPGQAETGFVVVCAVGYDQRLKLGGEG